MDLQNQISSLKNVFVTQDTLTNIINDINQQTADITPRNTNDNTDIIKYMASNDNTLNKLQVQLMDLNEAINEHESEINNLLVKTNGLESKLNLCSNEKVNIPKIQIKQRKQT
jgi:beta-N-acetylglucosaminidase